MTMDRMIAAAAVLVAGLAATAHGQWATNGTSIFYSTENVGVRTLNPYAALEAVSPTAANGIGVTGVGHSQSNLSIGVKGITFSANGFGGMFDGGQFGVYGRSVAPAGQTVGVWGQVSSPGGWGGVFKGGQFGVWGEANGDGRYAGYFVGDVYASRRVGIGTATPGATLDVRGGVRARGGAPGGSGTFNNGYAFTDNGGDNDSGMFSSGDGLIQFYTDSVERARIDSSGSMMLGTTSPQVFKLIMDKTGWGLGQTNGTSTMGTFVNNSTCYLGTLTSTPLVFFSGNGADGARLDGTNFSVTGTLSAGNKQFVIDHPSDPANKILRHSCIESDEMKNIYDGVATTGQDSYATVILPDWFDDLNENFRYQLTVIDDGEALDDFVLARVVQKVADNRFVIKTSRPGVEVSWQITGVRKDAFAKAHPMMVEERKSPAESGKYLHPEAFGQPQTKAIGYVDRAAVNAEAMRKAQSQPRRATAPAAPEPSFRTPDPVLPAHAAQPMADR